MKQAGQDIQTLWKNKIVFRIAASYIGLLFLLALLLPWLPLSYGPNDLDLEHIYQPPSTMRIQLNHTRWAPMAWGVMCW